MRKFNFYFGGFAATIVLTLSVILTELSEPFKSFLESIFIHHWIGKIILVAIVFVVFGFASQKKELFGKNMGDVAWKSVILSIIIILLFYIAYYFLIH